MSEINSTVATDVWSVEAPFIQHFAVQSQHVDGLKHTNNGCYVAWCEELAWRHSEALGISLQDFHRLDRAMALRQAVYDYRYASYLGETLVFGTWLGDMGSARMSRYFEVFREQDAKPVLKAHWQLACIEISSGRPKRLPTEFVKVYSKGLRETQR